MKFPPAEALPSALFPVHRHLHVQQGLPDTHMSMAHLLHTMAAVCVCGALTAPPHSRSRPSPPPREGGGAPAPALRAGSPLGSSGLTLTPPFPLPPGPCALAAPLGAPQHPARLQTHGHADSAAAKAGYKPFLDMCSTLLKRCISKQLCCCLGASAAGHWPATMKRIAGMHQEGGLDACAAAQLKDTHTATQ